LLSTNDLLHDQRYPLAEHWGVHPSRLFARKESTTLSLFVDPANTPTSQTSYYQHSKSSVLQSSPHTKVACLWAFNAIWSISPASSLVSLSKLVPMTSNLGNVASTILLKPARFSPDLKRKTRQIANKHCRPAKIEEASLVLSNWTVISRNVGHFSGKSECKIFCRTGMSCCRI
jgi:hypothetical protein